MNSIRNIFKQRSPKSRELVASVKKIVGFTPSKTLYYEKALTHSSTNQKDLLGNPISYERLEFVGDAILSAVIAHYLFDKAPKGDEGYLTKMRSKVVSRDHLNEIGKELGLSHLMHSRISVGKFGDNIHGNLFEALIGAVYLDKGYVVCEKFIYKTVINPHVDIDTLEGKIISYKGLIIEWCQKEKKHFNFEIQKDHGKDVLTTFFCQASLLMEKQLQKRGQLLKRKQKKKFPSALILYCKAK